MPKKTKGVNPRRPVKKSLPPLPTKQSRTAMLDDDKYVEVLDAALDAAETELRKLIPEFVSREITDSFLYHVNTHLASELSNIREHGHRNDDPDDTPPTAISVNLSKPEFDTLIAALRLWQKGSAHIADGDGSIEDLAEEHGEPLTNEDIDTLIERIN